MPTYIHVMVNPSINSETNSLRAIAKQISVQRNLHLIFEVITIEHDSIKKFILKLYNDPINTEYIILLGGAHGILFLKNILRFSIIEDLIDQHRVVIAWVGQQFPYEYQAYIKHINVLGLLSEYINLNPILSSEPIDKIVSMHFAPHMLTEEEIQSGHALSTWNKNHAHNQIPDNTNGYIMLTLPGDTCDIDGSYKYCTVEEAYQLGECIGNEVKKYTKHLLITNRSHTGAFYPESDPRAPVVLRFRMNAEGKKEWIPYSELTDDDKSNTYPINRAHTDNAPFDPISAAFLSALDKHLSLDRYTFINYTGDSAIEAMACAVYKYKNESILIYSGEAINIVGAFGKFITTYALRVSVMSRLHVGFTLRMNNTQAIKEVLYVRHNQETGEYSLGISSALQETKQPRTTIYTPEIDVMRIAARILSYQDFLHTIQQLPPLSLPGAQSFMKRGTTLQMLAPVNESNNTSIESKATHRNIM